MSTVTPIAAAESKLDMQQLAADVVDRAVRAGATEAEVVIREGDEFSTLVRLGQVETLKESGARGSACASFWARAERIAPPTRLPAIFLMPGWPNWFLAPWIWPRSRHKIPLPACPRRVPWAGLAESSTFITKTCIPCRRPSVSSMRVALRLRLSRPIRGSKRVTAAVLTRQPDTR